MSKSIPPNLGPRRILVIAHSPHGIAHVVGPLREAGCEVELATSSEDAIRQASVLHPELVVIDDQFGDLQSVEITMKIRSLVSSDTPPLFILAVANGQNGVPTTNPSLAVPESQNVRSMWVASAPLADASPPRDIANMVHPAVTSSQNLLKRISGVLAAQNRASEPPRLERIEHLGLTLDRVRHRVFVDGNPLHLTPTEFKLLWELASRPGFVLSRNELSQVCRGTMSTLHTRTVDAHIKAIRRKLAGYASFIETVHGVGYRFRESDAR